MAVPEPASNAALARDLAEIAALLRARRADRFRVRAYEQASRVVRALPVEVAALAESELRDLRHVGSAMAALIAEHSRTGRMGLLDRLREEEPAGFGVLVGLPLIGVREARVLAREHGFTDVDALRTAMAGQVEAVDLDERLAGRVRESLRRLPTAEDARLPLVTARRESAALAERLTALDTVDEALVAGAARRGADRIGTLALVLVQAGDATPDGVLREVAATRSVVRVLERELASVDVLSPTGHRMTLWLTGPEARGAALLFATGARGHVAALEDRAVTRGVELRPDGLWDGPRRVAGRTEDGVYAALGLSAVPPELREGTEEIEAAAGGFLPSLVRLGDVRGDLHVHSDWSRDGREPLEGMVRGAARRGYDYVAFTDHAENLTINGMPRKAVLARRRAITEVQQRHPHVRVLDAAELNIDLDGSLDYDLELLLSFDLAVASVHSHMDRPAAEQTERILAAVASPAVTIIGHPTGRIIGRRPGYEIDLAAIAEAAAETGTALEVNGSPSRLDLDAAMVRAAARTGATLSLSSDAHTLGELGNVAHAVTTARRGWARPADVINALDLDRLLAFAARKRSR